MKALEPSGLEILPVTVAHVEALGRLPLLHRDPFDRMLVVQSKLEQLTLITRDKEISRYQIEILRA
jgi:PIN domain nuclease of toxin-antitoxin system